MNFPKSDEERDLSDAGITGAGAGFGLGLCRGGGKGGVVREKGGRSAMVSDVELIGKSGRWFHAGSGAELDELEVCGLMQSILVDSRG